MCEAFGVRKFGGGVRRVKKRLPTIVFALIFIVGVCVLAYPTVSDWYNSLHASSVASSYEDAVADMTEPQRDQMLADAQEYNASLARKTMSNFVLSDAETAQYESLLGVNGVISYIEIPAIRVKLPIYHGTSEVVLQAGVGHLAGSSLPIGGASTHCVLSGHRGLPSAKLFTDIDQLVEGDVFILRTLGETYTYEVDQIRVVLPEELSELEIEPGQDLCTLVTCTPYGVNTHRLLVRGHRIANLGDDALAASGTDGMQIDPLVVAPFATIPILAIMLIVVFRYTRTKEEDYSPAKFDAAKYYAQERAKAVNDEGRDDVACNDDDG
jgi:sortase A